MATAKVNGTILCVDDYENILAGWKMLLEDAGYQVLTARDSSEALQLFARWPIDEVILDYQLTGVQGDIVARHMKALKPNVSILMVSGDDPPPEDKLTPAEAFLFKSSPIRDFLVIVKTLVIQSRLLRLPSATRAL